MIIHIDMSEKLHRRKTVGVAWCDISRKEHKGLALSGKDIKRLIGEVNADHDFARLYAILIYHLIKDDSGKIEEIIICHDECYSDVRDYLSILLHPHDNRSLRISSINEIRTRMGNRNFKSPANGPANTYRKRGLKRFQWSKRNSSGRSLNVKPITYNEMKSYWESIDLSMKDSS